MAIRPYRSCDHRASMHSTHATQVFGTRWIRLPCAKVSAVNSVRRVFSSGINARNSQLQSGSAAVPRFTSRLVATCLVMISSSAFLVTERARPALSQTKRPSRLNRSAPDAAIASANTYVFNRVSAAPQMQPAGKHWRPLSAVDRAEVSTSESWDEPSPCSSSAAAPVCRRLFSRSIRTGS
jgi:hypothetical protein